MKNLSGIVLAATLALLSACSRGIDPQVPVSSGESSEFSLSSVAKMMSCLPLEQEHLMEVHDAVTSSEDNGYDEEYLMKDLLTSPGSGVGSKAASGSYSRPIRELIEDYCRERYSTKAGAADVQAFLDRLSDTDFQIYWPYSEDWDGETFPIVTFDPGYGAESNYGYELSRTEDGLTVVDSVVVDENLARTRPVWVINSNDDSRFDPFVRPLKASAKASGSALVTATSGSALPAAASSSSSHRTLSLKSFKMLRHYDSWFRGASEFFVKCGSADGFKASTEEELKLYYPSVTDFMVVVKRKYKGVELEINSLMISDFTDQIEKIAFLVTEDDGGTKTSWKCSATVKYKSKSFGFDIDIPYNESDDIVWRGQLASTFFEKGGDVKGRFGDVEIVFGVEE